ncbi:MAG: carboxy terminal-processing peptidase [Saprospiraceae bacterium]|nr:carboxy terminal-processing peptidase [Saprospiraceae bacterium]
MKLLRGSLFFSLVAVAILFGAYYPSMDSEQKESVLINTILTSLQRFHFQPVPIDDQFSEKLFDLYMDRLDGGKRFLTKSDVKELSKFKDDLDDEAMQGTFTFFDKSYELVNNGITKTQGYYRDILSKPFDFSKKEEVETDGDKRDFASSDEELKEQWRLMLKYEVLRRVTTKLEDQEKGEDEELAGKSFEELEEMTRKDVLKVYDDWYDRLSKLQRKDRLSDYLNTVTNVYDPHTNYFEPIEKENFDIGMSGKLEGIGARLQTDGDYTKVSSIVPGGPAWKGKDLEENDVIMKVAQGDEEPVDITGMQINDVVSLIRGPKDTEVRLTVKKVDGLIKTITILRDVVVLEEGFAKSLIIESDLGDKVGYIKLPRFYADFEDASGRFCSDDIETELGKLKNESVDGIVLDLRNNGGGSLRDVVKMAGYFIEEGPIVQVKSRGRKPEVLSDTDPSVKYDGPLVVLVNDFSASASEILAAALQDYDRAVIVGTNSTFGKGTVQRFFDLDRAIIGNNEVKPLGQIKLTMQKFYRVNGGSTQLKGVIPDVILPSSYAYIETGEKENDYPLEWTEIPSVEYSQDVYEVNGLDRIVASSEKRVAQNDVFQKVEANAVRLKEQRDLSKYPLSLHEFQTWNDELEAEAKEFSDMFQPIESMKIRNLTVDAPGIEAEESKKARNDEWLKDVQKDVTLYETLNILHDLISNSVADVRKN